MNTSAPTVTKPTQRFRNILARIKHFDTLPPNIQEKLADVAQPHHYDEGQVIYVEGEPATAIYFIERGWVKSTRISCQGREQAMLCLCAGEVFGDTAVLTHSSYPCTVTALEPTDLWRIPADDLLRLMEQHQELAIALTKRMGERVKYYVDLVEDLSLCGVEVRIARTLLRNAKWLHGRWVVPRRTWSTFDEMAVRLGTVRDVLSRSLRSLEKEGLIKVNRQEIEILDRERLEKHSQL